MRRRGIHLHLFMGIALVLLLLAAGPVAARKASPRVIPPNAEAFGKSYEEWAAAWGQWLLETPATNHPLLDETGADCDEGQHGKVWFLAGNFGGETERTCRIPHGKAIFFPVINAWADNVDPFGPPTTLSEEELTEICTGLAANPSAIAVELDGTSLKRLGKHEIEPTFFSYSMPEDGLYDVHAEGNTFAGDVPEPGAVTCGTYVLLPPLSAGQHTVHFAATSADESFSLDVTYNLRIARS